MYGNGAYAISVCSMENSSLACGCIKDLISVTSSINEARVSEPMKIISFVGCLPKCLEKAHASP